MEAPIVPETLQSLSPTRLNITRETNTEEQLSPFANRKLRREE